MKLGRNIPPPGQKYLSLGDYLPALPTPPTEIDYSAPAQAILSDVMVNDQLGDCVIAGGYHFKGLVTANAGAEFHATRKQIIHDYSAIGGYNGSPSSDNGCNEQEALDYWLRKGWADGTRIVGWLKVNMRDLNLCRTACWLFEHLFYGSSMPNRWCPPQHPGFVWDIGQANPRNGHCFISPGYTADGFIIETWGIRGTLTNRAMQQNIDELYVMLDESMVSKINGKAPNAMDWATLVADWNSMGGSVAPPPPPMTFTWD